MATQTNTADVAATESGRTKRLVKKLNPTTDKKGKFSWRRALVTLIVVAAIVVAAVFGIKYRNAQNHANELASNPQAAAKAAVQSTVDAVGKLVQLPANETPTLATVTDASKLKNQAFFAKAENGDKVLIYTQAKLAVLYRPSTNKVINLAPLVIGNGTNSNNTSGTSGQ